MRCIVTELVSSVGLSKSGRVVGETPEGACVSVRVLLECNNDNCAALSQALLGQSLALSYLSQLETKSFVNGKADHWAQCVPLVSSSFSLVGALAAHAGLSKGDVIVEVYTILRKPSLLAALDLKVHNDAPLTSMPHDHVAARPDEVSPTPPCGAQSITCPCR